jgi:hypothetical protein
MVLDVGKDDWPFPIPLVMADGSWRFDSRAGAQELIDRRIGRNETAAIRTALAYVDAQKAFYAMTGQQDHAQYAQHLVATPGKHDGLYWPAAAGEPESPLAPLMEQAREEGYPGERAAGKPVPYHGYLFRILTGQGPSAAEGALDYVNDGRMTKGFALIAWPASFGASGIMSFIVDRDGIVFQKDLGPDTAAAAAAIKLFDPDLSWTASTSWTESLTRNDAVSQDDLSSPPRKRGPRGAPILASLGPRFRGNDGSSGKTLSALNSFSVRL